METQHIIQLIHIYPEITHRLLRLEAPLFKGSTSLDLDAEVELGLDFTTELLNLEVKFMAA